MILTPDQALRKTVMACQAAISKRGVAVLIVPVDIADSDAASEPPFRIHVNKPVIRPSDGDLDQIADMLAEGTNITIYAGSGCVDAHDEVLELAERLKAPVAHTSRGKDEIEYDNPNNVGMTGVIGTESGYHAILNCDTLLLLGTDFAWRQFYPDHAKIIQVDIDSTHIGRRHPVDLGVVGNIKDTIQALLPRVAQRDDATFLNTYVERHKKALKAQAERATPGHRGKIPGQYLTSIINRLANQDALFAADDGTPLVWMLRWGRGTVNGACSAASCTGPWRPRSGMPSDCSRPSRVAKSSLWPATAVSVCCSAMCSPPYKRICQSKLPFTTTASWDSWSSSRRAKECYRCIRILLIRILAKSRKPWGFGERPSARQKNSKAPWPSGSGSPGLRCSMSRSSRWNW